ncbi:hypothetical protein ACFO7V_05760 [Glutamicibacter bergerei]|uniref:Uncharacterized protein n=1 Tax=Glutamicibacter bergerei TaxID=256702 RepID=A0ABV9MLT7_9MICC|nr:hypothetical protein [Micrococcaceae bacterium]
MSARFNVPPQWQAYLSSDFHPATDWKPESTWGMPQAGWALWVDETTGYPAQPPAEFMANPYLNVAVIPGNSPATAPTSAHSSTSFNSASNTPAQKKPMGKGAKIGIGVAAVIIFGAIIGSCGGGDETTPAADPSTTPTVAAQESANGDEPTAEPAAEQSDEPTAEAPSEPTEDPEPTPEPEPKAQMPKVQKTFSDTVASASTKFSETDNELKASKAILDRDKSVCKATGGEFSGWKATVDDVGSTGDGYGYIAVLMEDDIELSTWNNALSDTFDNTLIKPSNKLYDVLMELSSGDEVTVSGNFIKGDSTCVTTSNMTEVMNASSPDFKVDFTSIKTK